MGRLEIAAEAEEPGAMDLNRDYEVTVNAYYPQYDKVQEKTEKARADTVEQAEEAVRQKWVKEGSPYHVMGIEGDWDRPDEDKQEADKRKGVAVERYAGLSRTAINRGHSGFSPERRNSFERQWMDRLKREVPEDRDLYRLMQLGFDMHERLWTILRDRETGRDAYLYVSEHALPLLERFHDHLTGSKCWYKFDSSCYRRAWSFVSGIQRILDRAERDLGRTWSDWLKKLWRKLGGK